jgi:hypothetical protein
MSLEVMQAQALFEIAGANGDLALALTPKLGEVREEEHLESRALQCKQRSIHLSITWTRPLLFPHNIHIIQPKRQVEQHKHSGRDL